MGHDSHKRSLLLQSHPVGILQEEFGECGFVSRGDGRVVCIIIRVRSHIQVQLAPASEVELKTKRQERAADSSRGARVCFGAELSGSGRPLGRIFHVQFSCGFNQDAVNGMRRSRASSNVKIRISAAPLTVTVTVAVVSGETYKEGSVVETDHFAVWARGNDTGVTDVFLVERQPQTRLCLVLCLRDFGLGEHCTRYL